MKQSHSDAGNEAPSARAAQATMAHLAQFSDEDLAYHEAGHAVVHHLGGGRLARLSIDRADPRRGVQLARGGMSGGEETSKEALEALVAVLVGGEVAATLHGTPAALVTAGGRVDHEAALRAAAEAGLGLEEAHATIDAAWGQVQQRLSDPTHWGLVEALARALLRHKSLDAEQIASILGR